MKPSWLIIGVVVVVAVVLGAYAFGGLGTSGPKERAEGAHERLVITGIRDGQVYSINDEVAVKAFYQTLDMDPDEEEAIVSVNGEPHITIMIYRVSPFPANIAGGAFPSDYFVSHGTFGVGLLMEGSYRIDASTTGGQDALSLSISFTAVA